MLKGYASSHDIRTATEEDNVRSKPPIRPNGTRSKSALPGNLPQSIDSLGLGLPSPATDVDSSNGFVYAGDVPAPIHSRSNPTSSTTLPSSARTTRAGYQYYDTQYPTAPAVSQDQLAYGLQNITLNKTPYPSNGHSSRHVTPAPVDRYNTSYPSHDSQQSSAYSSYYSQPSTTQFAAQDGYVDYTDPLTYFRAGVANGSQVVGEARSRESLYAAVFQFSSSSTLLLSKIPPHLSLSFPHAPGDRTSNAIKLTRSSTETIQMFLSSGEPYRRRATTRIRSSPTRTRATCRDKNPSPTRRRRRNNLSLPTVSLLEDPSALPSSIVTLRSVQG